jgi:hypothetical protein
LQPLSPEERTCRTCGSSLLPDHRFCPNCGSAVAGAHETTPDAPVDEHDAGARSDPLPPADVTPSWPDSSDLSGDDKPGASTLETREFDAQPLSPASQHGQPPQTQAFTPAPQYGQPQQAYSYPPGPRTPQEPGHPTWGTPETTVQPEKSNRTLWIILGIVAFIVLVCCCILPLGLTVISGVDTALQDELRVRAILNGV